MIAAEDADKGAELTCEPNDSSVSASDRTMRRAELIYEPKTDSSRVVINDKSGDLVWQTPSAHRTKQ